MLKNNMLDPSTCSCKNGKYLAGITCDEIIRSYEKEVKTVPKKFNEKKAICKTQNFHILLTLLLNTMTLLIAFTVI